jgi:hypothetical protein
VYRHNRKAEDVQLEKLETWHDNNHVDF